MSKAWACSRSPEAALTIALDLSFENIISIEEAIVRIEPSQINWLVNRYLINPHIGLRLPGSHGVETAVNFHTLGFGNSASNGVAVGKLVLNEIEIPSDGEEFIALVDCFNVEGVSRELLSASGFLCLGGGKYVH